MLPSLQGSYSCCRFSGMKVGPWGRESINTSKCELGVSSGTISHFEDGSDLRLFFVYSGEGCTVIILKVLDHNFLFYFSLLKSYLRVRAESAHLLTYLSEASKGLD